MRKLILLYFVTSVINVFAQQPLRGEVIPSFGFFYPVENPSFPTDTHQVFRVLFDVVDANSEPNKPHRFLDTAARFLNMHTQAGIPLSQLHVALVVHGGAFDAVLTDEAYKTKHGIENPNTLLISQLKNAGVQIILCGQTAAARSITEDKRNPQVDVALSAMTAILQLQNLQYRMIF